MHFCSHLDRIQGHKQPYRLFLMPQMLNCIRFNNGRPIIAEILKIHLFQTELLDDNSHTKNAEIGQHHYVKTYREQQGCSQILTFVFRSVKFMHKLPFSSPAICPRVPPKIQLSFTIAVATARLFVSFYTFFPLVIVVHSVGGSIKFFE